MGALMRAHGWASTPLGDPESWPQSLRTAVRILLTTQHPMFIWWGPELIQFYNDAYRKTMGPERHPGALGERGRECWAEIWDIIGPQIELVMQGKGATWHENQLVPVTRNGRLEDVWWTYSFGPIDDDDAESGVGGVLVVCNDVTDRHLAFEALARQEQRLELALSAGFIGTWEWNIGTNIVFADARLAKFYGLDAEAAAAGMPPKAFMKIVHPSDHDRLKAAIDNAVATRSTFSHEFRLLPGEGITRWLAAQGRCFYDHKGDASRFFGSAIDITARKDAELNRNLMANELAHRVKNMLAMVQAIANQTLRDAASIEAGREGLSSRLAALARSQDVLTGAGLAGADLDSVIGAATAPHGGDTDRFSIQGPKLFISAQSSLTFAMAFHELSTNATKYGALSRRGGRVAIAWRIQPHNAGEVLALDWSESGGPPVSAPTAQGFGTRLIKDIVASRFQAEVTTTFAADGFSWSFRAPLANVTSRVAV